MAFGKRMAESGKTFLLHHVEHAADAIEMLESRTFDLVLLDHDLGGRTYVDHTNDKEDCGMRVAEWFSIRPNRVRENGPIVVHSLNGPAAQVMVELIGEAIWAPFMWQDEVWRKYISIAK